MSSPVSKAKKLARPTERTKNELSGVIKPLDRANKVGRRSASRTARICLIRTLLTIFVVFVANCSQAQTACAQEATRDVIPRPKAVPRMQAIPLPYDQMSFQYDGQELVRYHFGSNLRRPFWFPFIGPGGVSYTRMGHPHDPVGHRHHYSVWIAHADVNGISFWADDSPGRILHRRVERIEDGDQATVTVTNVWVNSPKDEVLMFDTRIMTVEPLQDEDWMLTLRIELSPAGNSPVILGQTPFGLLGVRVAKTISVADGGGRIINSEGDHDEAGCFQKPARWVDYSGAVTRDKVGGITPMDHPSNPSYPTPFHVRNDGWMCPSVTLNSPIVLRNGEKIHFFYRLWVHAGIPTRDDLEARWRSFATP